jgi:peptide-methionine (S)-S-oxide reductase
VVTVAVLLAGATAGGVLMLRAAGGGGAPAVTSRTDYGSHHRPAVTEIATFAAGCFWKLEHAMRRVDGVVATTAGYTGGAELSPTHANVSTGHTSHAEAVRVEFDPSVVSYEALLDVFWKSHDPAQFAREPGEPPSPGRSVVFYHTDNQRAAAAASKRRLISAGKGPAEIPTEILAAHTFFPAEAEHQQFLDKRGGNASCRFR